MTPGDPIRAVWVTGRAYPSAIHAVLALVALTPDEVLARHEDGLTLRFDRATGHGVDHGYAIDPDDLARLQEA